MNQDVENRNSVELLHASRYSYMAIPAEVGAVTLSMHGAAATPYVRMWLVHHTLFQRHAMHMTVNPRLSRACAWDAHDGTGVG